MEVSGQFHVPIAFLLEEDPSHILARIYCVGGWVCNTAGPDGAVSMKMADCWVLNVCKLLPDYTALQYRRQKSPISNVFVFYH
jgi:hypothetical protein